MSDIISNLLDLNAIESGMINLRIGEISIGELFEKTIAEYTQKAEQKNIKLISSVTEETILADKNAVIEVMENLLSNAVKYSSHGKNIYLRAEVKNSLYRIEIKDEGPGLTEEDKKKLFQKFAKLSAKPTAGENSTGLGLSIVKKLVEAMTGSIGCESEAGQGATFIVELPLAHYNSSRTMETNINQAVNTIV
jgi:signal transduction histidine kinase